MSSAYDYLGMLECPYPHMPLTYVPEVDKTHCTQMEAAAKENAREAANLMKACCARLAAYTADVERIDMDAMDKEAAEFKRLHRTLQDTQYILRMTTEEVARRTHAIESVEYQDYIANKKRLLDLQALAKSVLNAAPSEYKAILGMGQSWGAWYDESGTEYFRTRTDRYNEPLDANCEFTVGELVGVKVLGSRNEDYSRTAAIVVKRIGGDDYLVTTGANEEDSLWMVRGSELAKCEKVAA